jgi:hypothetical protein
MIYIGVDNGKDGAIAMLLGDRAVTVVKMPDTEAGVAEALSLPNTGERVFAAVEQITTGPKMGTKAAMTFGKGHGVILGILAAFEIPFAIIPVARWQKKMHAGAGAPIKYDKDGKNPKPDTKKASIIVCRRKFPTTLLRPEGTKRKDDHNMADALLIAEYARLMRLGG